MARSSRSATVPVDEGTPGEFYFEYPRLVEIKSTKPPPPVTNHHASRFSGQTTARAAAYGAGACRLVSSHDIPGYTPPNNLEYDLARWPSQLDAEAYIEIHKVEGYFRGAIVTRKHQPKEYMDKIPKWGVIMFPNAWTSNIEWQPYYVKWFATGDTESAWAEDLYLIHAALDITTLDGILESQGYVP